MSQVAERYAHALFDVTEKVKKTSEVQEALSALSESIKASDDVRSVLESPLVNSNDKLAIVKNALGDSLSDELSTFFDLLAKNNRLNFIPQIVEAFCSTMAKTSGIMEGEVQSATELSDQEKSEIQKVIEGKLSQKVELQFKVNPNMMGGIEAKVGSYIFEDSIKSHIQKLNDFITRRVQ